MSNTGPNQDQVDIASALNKALEETSQLFDKVSSSAEGAAKSVNDALKSSAKYFENSEELTDQYEKLNKAMEKNADIQEESNGMMQKMAKKLLPKNIDLTNKYVRQIALMTTAYAGLNQGIEGTIAIFKMFQSGIMSGFNIIMGGLKVVGGVFASLWSASADYYNNMGRAVFSANQALIEQFGSLDGATGKLVKSFEHTSHASNILGQSGKSLYAVLGDTAERIGELGKMGAAFGELLVRLGHHAAEASDSMMLLEKGMGITYETMKTMAANAEASGGTLQEQLDSVAIASAHMANKFDIDVKQIGKGFDQMSKDVLHFGDIAPDALAATAAYAVKLGVEVKNLTGIMDQFDTFESAAQSAGMLAEAFGMNVDAMDMMMSDNPAERIDELRRAFQDTGKSVSDLSRHELKLLQQQMGGMDVESMKNALSMPVDEMGFDDFTDAMDEAGEQITLEDSLVKIADSIKMLEHAFTNLGAGPFASFVTGFEKIVTLNGTWRAIMGVNAEFLKKFQVFGMEIATSIASWVGSAEDAKQAFKDFYDFQGLQDMLDNLKAGFDNFLSMLKTNPGKAGRDFMQLIIDEASEYLSGVGGGAMVGGFKDIGQKIIIALGEMTGPLISKIAEILNGAAAFIRGDGIESLFGDSMQGGMLGALASTLGKVFDSLVDILLPALMDMFGALFDKIKPYLFGALAALWTAVLIKSIITALLQQALISIAVGSFSGFMGQVTDGVQDASNAGNGPEQNASSSIMETLGSAVDTAAEMDSGNIKKAGKNLAMSALYFLPSLALYALAAIGIAKVYQASGVGLGDMVGAFISIGTSLAALYGLSKLADKLNGINWGSLAKGMIAAAAVLAVGGTLYIGALWVLGKIWTAANINTDQVSDMFSAIAVSMLAVIAMATVGFLLGAALNGPQALVIIGGMVAAAALLAGGGFLYISALALLQSTYNQAAFEATTVETIFGSIGISMLALMGMVTIGALLGNPIGLIGMGFAVLGMWASSEFLEGPVQSFLKSLAILIKNNKELDTNKINEIMASVAIAMVVIGATILGFGSMKTSTIVKGGLVAGAILYAMSHFIEKITGPLTKIMAAFGTIKLDGSMENAKSIMDIISKMLDAAQSLGALAIDGAKIALASAIFGDSSMATVFNQMNGFIKSIIGGSEGGIGMLIEGLVKVSQSVKVEDIPKVQAVGSIIEGISSLVSSLTGPLSEIQSQSGLMSNLMGPSLSERTAEMITGIAGFMTALVGDPGTESPIKKVVDMMVSIAAGITDPDGIGKKATAMKGLFDGLNSIIEVVGSMMEQADQNGGFIDKLGLGDDSGTVMRKTFMTIASMFHGDAFKIMVNSLATAFSGITIPEGIADNIKTINSVMTGTMQEISNFANWIFDNDGINKINEICDWLYDDTQWTPSHAIGAIAYEAVAIANALQDMNIDLEEVKLEPQLQGIMSVTGKQEITVKPGAVNMTVNFNVTMDAEELAVTMHKGNDDTNNKGFFVLTEEASKSEAFGGDQ